MEFGARFPLRPVVCGLISVHHLEGKAGFGDSGHQGHRGYGKEADSRQVS